MTDAVGPPVILHAAGDGPPIADEGLFELVAVHPGTALDGRSANGQPHGC